jgi:tetratricopeptide (TPR) repeat protein
VNNYHVAGLASSYNVTGLARRSLSAKLPYLQWRTQMMDPENPVVKLCAQGMEYESKGNFEEASTVFMAAWTQSTDDFERCVAAHYVARHQKSPDEALTWNQRSLDYARALADDRVSGFFPSLYLNMGKAYEDLGRWNDARRFYAMTVEVLPTLPNNRYGEIIRDAVERAQERVAGAMTRTSPSLGFNRHGL